MKLFSPILLLTAAILRPATLVPVQYDEFSTCPDNVLSLSGIQSGARPANFSKEDRLM